MSSMEGVLQALAIILVLIAALLRVLSYYLKDKQGQLLYFPEMPSDARHVVPTPAEYGLMYEDLEIVVSDGVRVKAYFIFDAQSTSSQVTLIHFHGNAGNIGHRMPLARLLMQGLRCNVVLAEYRGYGLSETPPFISEEGLLLDASAVLDYVRGMPRVNPDGIVVHGTSLGGAVGIRLAQRCPHKMTALVVENTFTSISEMADELLSTMLAHQPISPWRKSALLGLFSAIKPLVLMIHWRSIDVIDKLQLPVLFISGTEDEIVPKEHMSRLFRACRATAKKLAIVEGGTHNATFMQDIVLEELNAFIQEHVVPSVVASAASSEADNVFRDAGKERLLTGSHSNLTDASIHSRQRMFSPDGGAL
ncbi:hypothetical protein DIPPA_70168 [Diplonema papillatum]|nr:hypothetical protein DIPPA_70168 [Diplonema papillatum]